MIFAFVDVDFSTGALDRVHEDILDGGKQRGSKTVLEIVGKGTVAIGGA